MVVAVGAEVLKIGSQLEERDDRAYNRKRKYMDKTKCRMDV